MQFWKHKYFDHKMITLCNINRCVQAKISVSKKELIHMQSAGCKYLFIYLFLTISEMKTTFCFICLFVLSSCRGVCHIVNNHVNYVVGCWFVELLLVSLFQQYDGLQKRESSLLVRKKSFPDSICSCRVFKDVPKC